MSGKKHIKTWVERCEEHPDHNGIVSERMIKARMQEEIDELREEYERLREALGALLSLHDDPCVYDAATTRAAARAALRRDEP